MKNYFLLLFLVTLSVESQEMITLEQCYTLAEQHYPLAKRRGLLEKSAEYTISNISKGYLPQIGVFGQATYQSDVVRLPISLPGIEVPELNKEQYKLYAEVNQVLFDGGNIRQQKLEATLSKEIDSKSLEVELYHIKDRINNLYFGILLIDEQLKQNELLKSDIQTGLKLVNAQIANGTSLRSNGNLLEAEYLTVTQQSIALRTTKKAYLDILALFINMELTEVTILQIPETPLTETIISRPELSLFAAQNQKLDLEKKTIGINNLPRLNFFVQGGVGNPGINMFNKDFDSYYIGGLRLHWNLSGQYTKKKQKQLLDINKQEIDLQKETFLFNTNHTLKQQDAEIIKLNESLTLDEQIILLRTNIKNAAVAQLENGVINANDYLKEVNAENRAKQHKSLHGIQLLMAFYNLKITYGN